MSTQLVSTGVTFPDATTQTTAGIPYVVPGTSGNLLTSNGTTWVSSASSSYAGFTTVIFTGPGSWTPPAGITRARIMVVGGGGGGSTSSPGVAGAAGGEAGMAMAYCTGLSGPYSITVGAGGAGASSPASGGASGGSSSISGTNVNISATGGGGAVATPSLSHGSYGSGTVTTGTALKTNAWTGAPTGTTATQTGLITIGVLTSYSGPNAGTSAAITFSASSPHPGRGGTQSTGTPNVAGGGTGGCVVIEY